MISPLRLRHRAAAAPRVALVAVIAATSFGGACILADPGQTLATPARPTILRDRVFPPASSVLGVFPDVFVIPVQLFDPTQSFEYRLFIDYDPATGSGLAAPPGTSAPPSSPSPDTIRTVSITTTNVVPPSPDECHVIEVLVATAFLGPTGVDAHTPVGEGDSVVWFYNPNADPGGCPTTDAGVFYDGGIRAAGEGDADADAGTDGDDGAE